MDLNIKMLKDNGRTVIIIEGADRERDEAAYRIVNAYVIPIGQPVDPAQNTEPVPQTGNVQSDVTPAYDDEYNPLADTRDTPFSQDAPPVKAAENTPENITEAVSNLPEVQGLSPVKTTITEPTQNDIDKMEDYATARQRGLHIISSGTYKDKTAFEALSTDNERALVGLFHHASSLSPCAEKDEVIDACKQYMSNLPETAPSRCMTRDEKLNFIQVVEGIVPMGTFINGYASLNSFGDVAGDGEVERVFTNIIWSLANRGGRPL